MGRGEGRDEHAWLSSTQRAMKGAAPPTSIALINMRVRRNGIFSGYLSRCIATSKQSPKSMCRILPEI